MDGYVNIILCRHPECDGDLVTPQGGMDAIRLARWLVNEEYTPDYIYYSGANRTRQAAYFMAVATDLYSLSPQKDEAFHYMAAVGKSRISLLETLNNFSEAIKEGGGHVAAALRVSPYARRCADHLRLHLDEVGQAMAKQGKRNIWVMSHGQFAEMAVPGIWRPKVPYGIGYCDAVIYRYDPTDKEVINCKYIPFPRVMEEKHEVTLASPATATEA